MSVLVFAPRFVLLEQGGKSANPGFPLVAILAPLEALAPLPPEELFARMSLEELNSTSPLDPVFFDLDMSELLPDGQAALRRNADWMRQWDSTRVTVQGHCDERGTNEYNLALGERRAAAVRDYLVSLGIAANRIATVSRGEESPFCTDSHEGCWSRNRRGHFVVTGK